LAVDADVNKSAMARVSGQTMSNILILAAKHPDSPEVQLFTLCLVLVALVVAVIAAINKSQNVNWKNGVPYCPGCNRQVSLKNSQSYCRSCGYNLVQSPNQARTSTEGRREAEHGAWVKSRQGENGRRGGITPTQDTPLDPKQA
jgi:rRNA maturation endonuclease Nob1